MNDIETRLRADATQVEPPPDFDAALRVATAPRRRSHAWLAAAAAVIVVAGGATALTMRHPESGGTSAAGSSGSPTDGPATAASVVGAIVAPDSNEPREMALVIHEPGPDSSTCPISLPALIESSTEVRVKLPTPLANSVEPGSCFVQPIAPDGSSVGPAVRMNASPTEGAEYHLYLPAMAQPLGTRPLIDDATGQPITVLAADPPMPGQVPDGYTVKPADNPMSSVWLDFQPGALAPLAVQRTYRNAANDRLVFVTAASDHVTAGAKVIDHTTVNGHDATVTESDQTRCVTWAPTADSGMQVCSDVSQATPAATSADLISEAELVQIANTVH